MQEDRLQQIRQAVEVEGSHHAEAFQLLKEKVKDGYEAFGATESNWNYARSYLAQSAAFLYQLTGNEKYADIAYETLVAVHEDPDPDGRLPEEGYGLSRATVGMGFALAYDWLHDAWSAEQRAYIRQKIVTALDAWEEYYHANIDHTYGSNWTAVCRGGELIMMLAVGEEKSRSERYETIKEHLKKHIRNGYDNLGVTQEGIGYTSYGGIFLLPAIYAAQSVGDDELYQAARSIDWHRQAIYAGSFAGIPQNGTMTGHKIYLMSGVGGPAINEEGWASLLLNWAPEEDLPYYLWWYDRHTGKLAVPRDDPSQRYDFKRQGTIWAMLYYPEELEAKDPTGVYPKAIRSGWGTTLFRNRWKNPDDIFANLIADGSDHSHAWSQTEAGQLGLIGFQKMFIGGPNKERAPRYYSKVLMNGKTGAENTTGRQVHFEQYENGGYSVIDGGAQYGKLGVDRYRRHMLVQFADPEKNEALVAVADRLEADSTMSYTWNLNYGSHEPLWGLTVETGTEKKLPTFTIQNEREGRFHGWVIAPEAADLETGESLQINQKAENTQFFVIGWTGRGVPPDMRSLERGTNGIRVQIGDKSFVLDQVNNRLFTGEQARNFKID
ncbi:hypothetical protein ACG2F4_13990 [Halalkalibaculum sp. DA3122]|uniref:hypothetical protein n=1 Tax=Halalkalibaculum sp. DA3122 TaxID=3373607 RepID=UPI003754C23F